ncbi:hypothetical protein ACFP81_05995 [Deinococcus lacus]|uniref:Glucose-1-phosphate adenylyltransferase/Bifunctional protein GlmU-like C-terminal hexapeptide domain-containing protein n=1 Tax=Deinococcus lacus TaxID=392561 RepID=A0ABW1YDI6_9DEIO
MGASVAGTVVRSVIAPGAVVEAGAEVRDSIIQPYAVVRAGAKVSRAIVDEGAEVGENAVLGGQAPNSRLSVLGASARLAAGAQVGPGYAAAPHSRIRAGAEDRATERIDRDDQAGE